MHFCGHCRKAPEWKCWRLCVQSRGSCHLRTWSKSRPGWLAAGRARSRRPTRPPRTRTSRKCRSGSGSTWRRWSPWSADGRSCASKIRPTLTRSASSKKMILSWLWLIAVFKSQDNLKKLEISESPKHQFFAQSMHIELASPQAARLNIFLKELLLRDESELGTNDW